VQGATRAGEACGLERRPDERDALRSRDDRKFMKALTEGLGRSHDHGDRELIVVVVGAGGRRARRVGSEGSKASAPRDRV
jgi:hypothetical protein